MDPASSERFRQADAVFDAALDLTPEERTAYVDRVCADDPELRAAVLQLLDAHERADRFLATPAAELGAPMLVAGSEPPLPPHPKRVGPYRLVREIGHGGMGAVYLAERDDAQFRQRVALKLVRGGFATGYIVQRFLEERQLLASLEHPHIARLLDGGVTPDGEPYFAMEYIEGLPLDRYCDRHRLSIEQRLQLFRDVCEAVQYAHRNLIVHRDLKPSNILVTEAGEVKLLDFGIAKLLTAGAASSDARLTRTETRLMTPEYASPEQVRGGPITTATDVYALGVVLYELLVGQRPYEVQGRTPGEIERIVAENEPPRPSTAIQRLQQGNPAGGSSAVCAEELSEARDTTPERLQRRLRGELDTIVMKALQKESERRYPSAAALLEDLKRYADGRPLMARPDSRAYRTRKFVSRNRTAVAAVALVLVTLVGGTATTAWQARRARAQEELARAEQARAERRFNEVRKLARSVLFDYHDAIKDLPGATPVRARLVRDALEYLNSLAGEAGGDPTLQNELAAAYVRVGDVQGGTMFANLGDTRGAIDSYRRALQVYEALQTSQPRDREVRRGMASSHHKLGSLLWETGDIAGALENIRKMLAIFQSLAAEDSTDLDLRFELGRGYDVAGMILQEQGDARGALEHYRRALAVYESLPSTEQGSERGRRAFSVEYEHIGAAQLLAGDLEAALENNRKALALRTALSADFPLNADYRRTLQVSHFWNGDILAKMDRTREALASFRESLAIAGDLSAVDPANEQYRGDLAYALIQVGNMLAELGDREEALQHYRQSRDLRAADVQADPVNLWKRASLIEAHAKITRTLAQAGHAREALAEGARTFSLMEQTAVEPTNALFRGFFADTYSDLGATYFAVASNRRTPAPERREHERTACAMHRRSAEIWQDLRNRAILSRVDADKPEIVAREIARCDTPSGQ